MQKTCLLVPETRKKGMKRGYQNQTFLKMVCTAPSEEVLIFSNVSVVPLATAMYCSEQLSMSTFLPVSRRVAVLSIGYPMIQVLVA
jgi:hypothetical protein